MYRMKLYMSCCMVHVHLDSREDKDILVRTRQGHGDLLSAAPCPARAGATSVLHSFVGRCLAADMCVARLSFFVQRWRVKGLDWSRKTCLRLSSSIGGQLANNSAMSEFLSAIPDKMLPALYCTSVIRFCIHPVRIIRDQLRTVTNWNLVSSPLSW